MNASNVTPVTRSEQLGGGSRSARAVLGVTLLALVACAPLPPRGGGTEPPTWIGAERVERNLDRAPDSQQFIAPGLDGIYATLRRSSEEVLAAKQPLEPYVPYGRLSTPPDPKRYNLRQIVIKLKEGSGIRLRDRQFVRVPETQTLSHSESLKGSHLVI